MSTITSPRITTDRPDVKKQPTPGQGIRNAGRAILLILGSVLLGVTMLPVVLLPLITSVPWYAWLALAIIDAGLLFVLVAHADTLPYKLLIIAAIVGVSVLAVFLSQWFASTPPIVDADGRPVPGSIAELEQVELNGSRQWISIRGHDQTKPVLLFLAGGPGGSQLAATRKQLGELEQHFVVVNWEQPGAGKSYGAVDVAGLTPERYVDDGLALTRYLRQRFDQEKIYILGESWGTALGVWMVQRAPDMYHAFAGAAQMVDFLETDLYDYDLALRLSFESGNFRKVAALKKQGPPPYYGKGVARKFSSYVLVLSQYMMSNPAITGPGYDTFGDIAADEYGLVDKVNYAWGLLATLDAVYWQLWDVDLREQAPRLEVPVYFLEGRHDVNAPPALAEDYLQKLAAPHKELIWFEHSGHSPWVDEAAKVVDVMVNKVLAGTTP
ncbi:MAG: alpha/beta hydrolase [Candidatus Promineofilum sp.]|nr:alpha/beta hydrolase [Promineifilum sp.]